MREYLLGALGVALAYPVVWYQMEPEPLASTAVPAAVREVGSSSDAPVRRAVRETTTRQVASAKEPALELEVPGVEPTRAPTPPRAPSTPTAPLPDALPKTIEQMSELQRLAHDPVRLAERVQGMESNAAELDELKAFAEKFVKLPPERVDPRIMNPSGRAGPSRPAARR